MTYTVHVDRLNPHPLNTIVQEGLTGTRYAHKDAVIVEAESEDGAIKKALGQASDQRWNKRYGRSR